MLNRCWIMQTLETLTLKIYKRSKKLKKLYEIFIPNKRKFWILKQILHKNNSINQDHLTKLTTHWTQARKVSKKNLRGGLGGFRYFFLKKPPILVRKVEKIKKGLPMNFHEFFWSWIFFSRKFEDFFVLVSRFIKRWDCLIEKCADRQPNHHLLSQAMLS